jgi:hypothetical protein
MIQPLPKLLEEWRMMLKVSWQNFDQSPVMS